MGSVGEYEKEVFWTSLGYGRSAIFEVTVSDPVKFAILDAFLNFSPGDS
jgi:hypothetical protein